MNYYHYTLKRSDGWLPLYAVVWHLDILFKPQNGKRKAAEAVNGGAKKSKVADEEEESEDDDDEEEDSEVCLPSLILLIADY